MKNYCLPLLLSFFLVSLGCGDDEEDLGAFAKLESQVWAEVNKYRDAQGKAEFEHCSICKQQGRIHSNNMATGKVSWGHDGFSNRSKVMMDTSGGTATAENIHIGQKTAEAVVQAWLDSQDHKDTIDGDYTHMDVGIAQSSSGTHFYTQLFIKIR